MYKETEDTMTGSAIAHKTTDNDKESYIPRSYIQII